MRIIISILGVMVFALSVSCEKTRASEQSAIDDLFSDLDQNTPGAAFVVVRDGKVLLSDGYGMANLQYDIPMTPETVVDVASVSKQFTAFSIMLLVEDGSLSLDDDVRKHIPELPDYDVPITLRHLLTHTSGLREWIQLLHLSGYEIGGDIISRDHVFNLMVNQKALNFLPGEKFSYTNSGYDLLGIVVERASGKKFSAFAHERIFEPLGMENTFLRDDYQKIIPNEAARYYNNGDAYEIIRHQLAIGGSSGVHTTMSDLSLWMLNFDQLKIGNEQLFEAMSEPGALNNGERITAAFGQFVTPHKGLYQLHHEGGGVGVNTHLTRFSEQGFSVAVTCNEFSCDPRAKAEAIAEIFLGDLMKQQESESTEPVDIDPAQLKAFAADYWNENNGLVRKVYFEDDQLWYMRSAENKTALIPVGENMFVFDGASTASTLQFGRDERNRKTMAFVYDGEAPQVFTEYEPRSYVGNELDQFTGAYYSEELFTLYNLNVNDGVLSAENRRGTRATFRPVMTDTFAGSRYAFSTIKYVRDQDDQIVGMVVTNPGAKGILFEKIKD